MTESPDSLEANRFKDLLRRLSRVPKKEIDDLEREPKRDPSDTEQAGDEQAQGQG